MGDLFSLSERQTARTSPDFPLPRGVPRVDERPAQHGPVLSFTSRTSRGW